MGWVVDGVASKNVIEKADDRERRCVPWEA